MQTIVGFNVYPKPLSVVGIEGKSSCNGLNQIKSQTPKLQIQYTVNENVNLIVENSI